MSKQTSLEAKYCKDRLVKMALTSDSNIYVDTLISPSYTSSIAQVIQLPGMAGTENNLILFEFSKNNPTNLTEIVDNYKLVNTVDFDMIVLASSEKGFGLKQQIHIWITAADYHNANLMILLSYIIMGHRDWKNAEIKIFAIYPENSIEQERNRLIMLVEAGQLPISPNNIEFIPRKHEIDPRVFINEKSRDADLVILGFRGEAVKQLGTEVFEKYDGIGNILFVNTADQKSIK